MQLCTSYRSLLVLSCVGMGIMLLSLKLHTQAFSGDLVGSVTDQTGVVVPNVTITVTNIATDVQSSGKSNSNGLYCLSNLLPGDYNISATAAGFTTFTPHRCAGLLNQTATVNITLAVGSVSTSVEVAANTIVDATTAQIQSDYTGKQLADLPTNTIGVEVINVSLPQAGVASAGRIGTGPSVGAQRPRNNNFTIERVDNNRKDITGPNTTAPSESVAEFTLLQNQFQAEFGHSSGRPIQHHRQKRDQSVPWRAVRVPRES